MIEAFWYAEGWQPPAQVGSKMNPGENAVVGAGEELQPEEEVLNWMKNERPVFAYGVPNFQIEEGYAYAEAESQIWLLRTGPTGCFLSLSQSRWHVEEPWTRAPVVVPARRQVLDASSRATPVHGPEPVQELEPFFFHQ